MELSKERYDTLIALCLKFDKFNRFHNKITNLLRPSSLAKYNNFEFIDDFYSKNGKEQWEHFDIKETENGVEAYLSLKKFDTSYHLAVCTRDFSAEAPGLEELNNSICANYLAYIEVANHKKGTRFILEIDALISQKDIRLLFKDCSHESDEWKIERQMIYLTDEEKEQLLGVSNIKNI